MQNTEGRLIVQATTIPDNIERHSVVWLWTCFNYGSNVEVTPRVFQQLETRKLLGVKCPDCLRPTNSGIVAAA